MERFVNVVVLFPSSHVRSGENLAASNTNTKIFEIRNNRAPGLSRLSHNSPTAHLTRKDDH
jgi:hypothetical protein